MIKVLVISNPKSGVNNYENSINKVINLFKNFNIEHTLIKTSHGGHAIQIVSEEDISGYDSVCAMGGDGTLFEVLNGMFLKDKNKRRPISVIPNGTGNSFMKTIGVEDQLNSIEKIAKNKSKRVDVMKAVCGKEVLYSLNLIGWGMATDISVLAEDFRIFGGQRYNIASFFEIIKNKRRTAKIIVDGIEREDDFAFIIACNTKYVGKDMKMAPNAEIDDGKIDLIIVREAPSLTLFSVFPKLFDGSHINHDACEYVHCESFSIIPETTGKLNIDGEIIGSSPVTIEILKSGVDLII